MIEEKKLHPQATGLPQTSSLTSYYFGGAYEVTHSTGSGQADGVAKIVLSRSIP